jgi:cellulose synthase/poly-beta-1,6-N-acetylglucosamine synthase-like glycosyltransferase
MLHDIRSRRLAAEPARVSVLLPVRNGQRFVADAIESILNQTFTDLELLVVDDGSEDATASIARAYEGRDDRVRVLTHPRMGLVAALNAGMAAARGLYIARMDADDISKPARLAAQVAYLDRHATCVAIGTAVDVVDADGRLLGYPRVLQDHDAIVEALLDGAPGIVHPTVMMRRNAAEQAGGYLDGTFPCEDRDLWLRMSRHGRLANLGERLLTYRRSEDTVAVQTLRERRASRELVINRARTMRGLPAWTDRPDRLGMLTAPGRYHWLCARAALTRGARWLAALHALQGLRHDPWTWHHYATLCAAAMPRQMITALTARRRRHHPEPRAEVTTPA